MKGLDSGKDKVKHICDILKKETLEPAKQEAEKILETARNQADEILADAHVSAKKMLEDAFLETEKQKAVFQASLTQACRQTLETLKEKIEHRLFNPELSHLISKPLQDPKIIAQIITAIVRALEKEGTESDLSVAIAGAVQARAVNELLSSEVLNRLKEKSVLLSSIGGGVEVKLLKDHITIDLSDETLKELISNYIRKDFRDFIFNG